MLNDDKQLQLQLNKLKVQAPSTDAIQTIIQKSSKIHTNSDYAPTETLALSLLILPKKIMLSLVLILGVVTGWVTNDINNQDIYLFSDNQQGVFYE